MGTFVKLVKFDINNRYMSYKMAMCNLSVIVYDIQLLLSKPKT